MQYNTHGSVDAAGGPNVWWESDAETGEKEAPATDPVPAGEPPAAEPVAGEPPAAEGDGQQPEEEPADEE